MKYKNIYKILVIILLHILLIPAYAQAQHADADERLLQAAADGDQQEVLRALLDTASINAATEEGVTALMYAAQRGDLELVNILLYNGADPNRMPVTGYNALMSASAGGYLEVAEALIRKGGKVDTCDENGVTPLMYAAAYNQWLVCDMLLFYHAAVSKKDHDSIDALMAASYAGNTAIAGLLIQKGANPSSVDRYGCSPLWYALKEPWTATVDTLLDGGAAANGRLKVTPSMTPLFYARYYRDMVDFRRIRKAGGKINGIPVISRWLIGFDLADFNGQDYMCGLNTGIFEGKSATSVTLGFTTRLAKNKILYPVRDNFYYQLPEGRGTLYLQAQKMFRLPWGNVPFHYGPFLGGRVAYTFGRYAGIDLKVDDAWLVAPQVGLAYLSDSYDLRVYYTYLDFGTLNISPHRVGVSLTFHIKMKRDRGIHSIFWIN